MPVALGSCNRILLHPLANLLGPKCADAVQAKREDDAVFIAQANVESEYLSGDHAALPGVAEGRRGADERAVAAGKWMFLKIEEE